MNHRTLASKPRHVLFAALFAVSIGGVGFACGSDDNGGVAPCSGNACDGGAADDASRVDGDRPDGAASDAAIDAPASDADGDAARPPYTGSHLWSKLFGSNKNSAVQGARLATDSAGNVFIAGTLTGDADFGGGVLTGVGADVYLAKLDKDGKHLWSKKFGDADVQGAGSVVVDGAGAVFIGGNFNGTVDFGGGPLTSAGGSDIFVAKFDASGNHVWSKSFGDPTYQSAGGLTLVGADVVLIGEKSGTVDFGGGALTGRNYLVKLSGANGAHLWSKQSTSGAGFVPRGLASDPMGNLVGVGELGSSLDWGGGLLTSAGGDDVLVIKFDSNGNTVWSKRFGDGQSQGALDVATDGLGAIYLTGTFSGSLDFGAGVMAAGSVYITKLDKDGGGVWSKGFGTGLANCPAVAVDTSGAVAIGGSTHNAIDLGGGPLPATVGTPNIFFGKFDTSGKPLWSKGWASGAGGINSTHDVAFDSSGNLFFAGGLHLSSIDMGGGPLTTTGAGGFLAVAKFAP